MRNIIYFGLLYLSLLFSSCSLIFEEDISEDYVSIISPQNGIQSTQENQEFIWEIMESAVEYRLRIVRDSFSDIKEMILDSIIQGNKFRISLSPAHYQWRLEGINSAYNSASIDYNLRIAQDTNINTQSLLLISPQNNASFTQDSISFLWGALSAAHFYQIQIATDPSFNSLTLVKDSTMSTDYCSLINELGLGQYYWRVRALNTQGQSTAYTLSRSFTVDNAPTLLSPTNNTIVNSLPINLQWNSVNGRIIDSLYLYYNGQLDSVIAVNTNQYNFSSVDTLSKGPGNYAWRVRSKTNIGMSLFSNYFEFIIN